MPHAKERICIIKDCSRDQTGGRGLCKTHFRAASRRVKKGRTTWEELELLGLALPTKVVHDFAFDHLIEERRTKMANKLMK